VEVFINDQSKGVTTADEAGDFEIEVALVSGNNAIQVRAIDRAGNEGEKSTSVNLEHQPEHLLAIVFRSSKVMKRGSGIVPVKVVYYLSRAARVKIRIYNLVGDLVFDWEEQVLPGEEEEWSWPGKNMYGETVNNGVYILRISAQASSESDTVTKLVGVLR